jgi:ATP-binding cassette subfamily B protein
MRRISSGPRHALLSLRGLVPFLRPHRALLYGWLGALAFSSTATLFFPWAFRHVIDSFTHPSRRSIRWFLLMFASRWCWRWRPRRASTAFPCWASG